MSSVLTEEQRAFRDVMRSFVDEQVAPYAAGHDRDQTYPQESFDACVKMTCPRCRSPRPTAASGDMVTQAIMIEQLARGCAATSVTILISKLAMLPIMNFASEEIKQAYLPRIASGEIQGSYCLSEADAGSDVASMRCRAVRDGDDYILNGSKYWITNAGVSDTYTVFATTDPTARTHGITCFLVEKGPASNFRSTRTRWDCVAHRPARWSSMTCVFPRRTASAMRVKDPHRHAHTGPLATDDRRPGGRHRPGGD